MTERESVRERERRHQQQTGIRSGSEEEEDHDKTGWKTVTWKKKSGKKETADVARNFLYHPKSSKRTTFFFTNFPDNFRAKHMLKAFLLYGDFEEVVIPAKRDKIGKRFGFARAVNVQDPEKFATKLDNITIGREKIMVNIPRFERKPVAKQSILQADKGTNTLKQPPNPHPQPVEAVNSHHKKPTFNQASVSKPQAKYYTKPKPNHNTYIPKPPKPSKPIPPKSKPKPDLSIHPESIVHQNQNIHYKPPRRPRKAWAHRHINVDEDEIKKLSKAYVGVVRKLRSSYTMQEEFTQQGYFSVKATPMGSKLVLLESIEEGAMEVLIEEAQDWLRNWFKDIRKWSPGEVDNERLIWVRCHGVPVQAWTSDFFTRLMFGTGTFIKVDEKTEKKESLDVARVLISTKVHDVIIYVERIDINGELFVIKVVEDWIVSKQRCEKCHGADDYAAGEDDDLDDSGEEDLGDDDESEFSDEEVEETMSNDEGCNNQEANLNSIGLDRRVAADMVNIVAMRDNSKETQLIGNVGNCNNIIHIGAEEAERPRHVEGKKQVNNVTVGDENVLPCFDNSLNPCPNTNPIPCYDNSLNTNPNTNPIEAQPSPAGAKNSPEPVNPLPSLFTPKIRPRNLPSPTLSARSSPMTTQTFWTSLHLPSSQTL